MIGDDLTTENISATAQSTANSS